MGPHTKFKSAALAFVMVVAALLGFQNCGKFTTQAFKDSFTSLCAGQTIAKIKALAAAAPVSHLRCDDSAAYSCLQRVFRPGVGYRGALADMCTQDGACFAVKIMNFDTHSALKEDRLPSGAFHEGGEYNHHVFECEYSDAKVEGISVLTAEADTLGEAWVQVRKSCETRMQNAR
jgi:hypothetical protein